MKRVLENAEAKGLPLVVLLLDVVVIVVENNKVDEIILVLLLCEVAITGAESDVVD